MKNTCNLSKNSNIYIDQFDSILKEMIHKMSCVDLTQSISGNFILQMIPHHHAAIAMSENLLRFTTNIPLQCIAQNIISAQKKSIEDLKEAYATCHTVENSPQELATYQKRNECILKNMFRQMECACASNSIDVSFIHEMLPHHEGAIHMSENILCYPICAELIPILNAIITSQKRGVRQMQQILKQLTCR